MYPGGYFASKPKLFQCEKEVAQLDPVKIFFWHQERLLETTKSLRMFVKEWRFLIKPVWSSEITVGMIVANLQAITFATVIFTLLYYYIYVHIKEWHWMPFRAVKSFLGINEMEACVRLFG